MRIDAYARRALSERQIEISSIHTYTMMQPVATWGMGGFGGSASYRNISSNTGGNPYLDAAGDWWPSIKALPGPSTYAILMDGGNSGGCGGLFKTATTAPTSDPSTTPAARHDGVANCLFGDFHVEGFTAQTFKNGECRLQRCRVLDGDGMD
jgi:prepilin-type processing-associated H-X9-DG protein